MGDHDINISFADRVRDWLFHLDRILRGEATRPDKIRNAEIRIPILGITGTIVMLATLTVFVWLSLPWCTDTSRANCLARCSRRLRRCLGKEKGRSSLFQLCKTTTVQSTLRCAPFFFLLFFLVADFPFFNPADRSVTLFQSSFTLLESCSKR